MRKRRQWTLLPMLAPNDRISSWSLEQRDLFQTGQMKSISEIFIIKTIACVEGFFTHSAIEAFFVVVETIGVGVRLICD
jgi:hypothetical protein